jgi:hypothetical protein
MSRRSSDGSSKVYRLRSKVNQLARRAGGTVEISVRNSRGNLLAQHGGNSSMPTRSSYKVYTAYATMRAVDAGRLNWNTRVRAYGNHTLSYTMFQMIGKIRQQCGICSTYEPHNLEDRMMLQQCFKEPA